MLKPGKVSIVDLSDTDSPQINNLVIAQLLRGVQRQQEENYSIATKENKAPTPVMIFIEEAHEFLSAHRIAQMPVLFQQVARIARRGRKRWLGLGFITQLPQHLPDEVLGLINNWVLHKINDAHVVARLRKSIGGIDEGLWNRLPSLTPAKRLSPSRAWDGLCRLSRSHSLPTVARGLVGFGLSRTFHCQAIPNHHGAETMSNFDPSVGIDIGACLSNWNTKTERISSSGTDQPTRS